MSVSCIPVYTHIPLPVNEFDVIMKATATSKLDNT